MYTGPAGVDSWGASVMGDPSAYGLDSGLVNQPIGSAESSLYGSDVLNSPSTALDSGTQAAAPITDLGTPARVGDVLRNGGIPGLSNFGQSLGELGGLGNIANALGKIPGLGGGTTGSGSGGGGGSGGGLLAMPSQYNPLAALIQKYYGSGLLGH